LYASVLGSEPAPGPATAAGLAGEERDPVCGMRVDKHAARRLTLAGRDWFFCARECQAEFARDPQRFLRAEPGPRSRD